MTDRFRAALATVRAFFTPAWEVREEAAGGDITFGIYRRLHGRVAFVERWATLRTAGVRLAELEGKTPTGTAVPVDRIARAVESDAVEGSGTAPESRVYRGNRAREVLENESYEWAFHSLKMEIIESWQKAPEQDPEGREKLWLSLKLLEKVRANLTARLETGKLARLELAHRAKAEKEARAWLE